MHGPGGRGRTAAAAPGRPRGRGLPRGAGADPGYRNAKPRAAARPFLLLPAPPRGAPRRRALSGCSAGDARSPGRRIQLANVVRGYETPGNDSVPVFDVDSALRRSALRCASWLVGTGRPSASWPSAPWRGARPSTCAVRRYGCARGPALTRSPGRIGCASPAHPTASTTTWLLRYGPWVPTGSSRSPGLATVRWTCGTSTARGGGSPTARSTGPAGRRGGPRRGKGRGAPAAAPGARLAAGRVAPGLGRLQGREEVDPCRAGDDARAGARQGPARAGPREGEVLGIMIATANCCRYTS